MEKKQNKKDIQYQNTHKLIYKVANELFLQKSYDSVTIREICDKCNISIGNFYHHFSSKLEILNETFHLFDHIMETDLKYRLFDNPKDKILYIFNLELSGMEKFGVNSSTYFFKNLLVPDKPYILDDSRYFYKELYKASQEYIELYNINVDNIALVEELLRVSRGNIYDWCLHNGDYNLLNVCMKTLNRILDSYESKKE